MCLELNKGGNGEKSKAVLKLCKKERNALHDMVKSKFVMESGLKGYKMEIEKQSILDYPKMKLNVHKIESTFVRESQSRRSKQDRMKELGFPGYQLQMACY